MNITPTRPLVSTLACQALIHSFTFGVLMPFVVSVMGSVASAAETGNAGGVSIFASESAVPARLFRVNPENGSLNTVGATSFFPGLDFRGNGVLYGSSSTLSTVSTATGTFTTIGPLPELIVSIAFSPTDELYGVGNDGLRLHKIDPRTGASLSSVLLTGTVFSSGSGTPFPGEINGIDFSPDGKLYGIGFGLYLIDPNTGVATRITPSGRAVAATSILFADLDFGPDGQLRAVTSASGEATSNLYLINPTSGIGQLVGQMEFKVGGIATLSGESSAPVTTTQPFSLTVITGQTASFTVTATGLPAPTYQWRKGGADIAGATGAVLTLANITPAAVGTYTVVVTNFAGSITSRAATLDITNGSPGRLINLSILTSLNRSGDSFTVGTVIGGGGNNATTPMLIRAVGPSLTQLGVGGVLADPTIDIFSGSVVTATNDNWGGGTELSAAFAQVGAFAFAGTGSRDAAVFVPALPTGNYTVQVSGVAGATGTVIAEIYNATPATEFNNTTPRLINVSVLKEIAAGTTLTAGFAIGGSASVRVLIRAIGPGITQFGVAAPMADPVINLFDTNSRGISSNDNWAGSSALVTAFSSVGAFSIGANSADAAVLVTLQPGNYTAQVSGAAGTGGTVLVEVYELP